MGVRKSKEGLALKRWFKEDWKDEKGNACGSTKGNKVKKCRPTKRVNKKTPVTWGEMSKGDKKKAVATKKRVGMGKRTKSIKRGR